MNKHMRRYGTLSPFKLNQVEINEILGACVITDTSFFVNGISTIDGPLTNRVCFLEAPLLNMCKDKTVIEKNALIISDNPLPGFECYVYQTAFPRLFFAKITEALFRYYKSYWTGWLDQEQIIARYPDSIIMQNVNIHESVEIGVHSIIMPGVVIGPNSRIGDNAFIKSNSVISQPGFGIYRDSLSNTQHLPHVGGVCIGNNVEIGANATVCSGTIHPTTLEDHVKVDDHVHISHNCYISTNTCIAAHAILGGSTHVGRDCWLSPNVSTVESTVIGSNSFVGIGSTVNKDIASYSRVVGNPARTIKANIQ